MGTHRKTWSKTEKMEVIGASKRDGVLEASRQFGVSQTSIYKWIDKVESGGETSLDVLHATELRRENKRLMDENKQLKEMTAEKELKIRILELQIKKK